MIKVAVVDDEEKERSTPESEIFGRLQREYHEEIQVQEFPDGESLLKQYDFSCDLICLDIELGEGTDRHGERDRKMDENVILLFITNMAQLAIKGYEVRAVDFIKAHLSYCPFSIKMRSVINLIRSRKAGNIVLNMPGGIQKISTEQLYYRGQRSLSVLSHGQRGL